MEWKVIQNEETGKRRPIYKTAWDLYATNKAGQKVDGRDQVWVEVNEYETRKEALKNLDEGKKVSKRDPVVPVEIDLSGKAASPAVPAEIEVEGGFDPAGAQEQATEVPVVAKKKPGPKAKAKA